LRYWLPAVLWASLIFSASTGAMSARNTSRFIGPFLHWLVPDISDEAVRAVQIVVRKTAHAVEYGLLSYLLWRVLRKPKKDDDRPWTWGPALGALALAFLYAVTDEFHQSFVPSRGASPGDVMLDTVGAALGLVVVWSWGRWRRRW